MIELISNIIKLVLGIFDLYTADKKASDAAGIAYQLTQDKFHGYVLAARQKMINDGKKDTAQAQSQWDQQDQNSKGKK